MLRKKVPILFDKGCDPIILEPYRLLRTHIKVSSSQKSLQTLLVTSTSPGEGKSTVSSNLAFSLAQDGASVLLVDADLRFPTLHKIFHLENTFGLTDAVTKTYSMEVTKGVLGKQGIGDILEFIRLQEKTGSLSLQGGDQNFCISFERGQVIDATWDNRPKEKRLGSVLVKDGKITEQQLAEALRRQQKTSHALGHILTRLGYINSQDFESALKSDMTGNLHEACELREASFAFQGSQSVRSKRNHRVNNSELKESLSKEAHALVESDQNFIEEKINSYIRGTKIKNLSLLTSGSPTTHPSEVLSSERMKSLISILSNKYDFVIFDSPPIISTADSSILGSFLDGVIFVVQAGRLNTRIVQQARDELMKVKSNIIGVVLNQLDMKKEGYYKDYYQYYGRNGR